MPTQPVPTQPVPTQPVPTQPVPTQPVPTQPVSQPTSLDAGRAVILERSLDAGILCYKLKLTEVLLLLILKRETFSRLELSAPVRLGDWAREMGFRVDKLEPFFFELIQLKIVDFNEGQGSYRLRPNVRNWSGMRGYRVSVRERDAAQELPLVAERPLDDALSDLATESALMSGTEVPGQSVPCRGNGRGEEIGARKGRSLDQVTAEDWAKLREDIAAGTCAAEKSPETPEKFAGRPAEKSTAVETPAKRLLLAAAEKSPASPKASLAEPVQKAKLASLREEKSAEALDWLRKVDSASSLERSDIMAQWTALCDRDPDYVLTVLKTKWEKKTVEVTSPLAFLFFRARDDKKIQRLGRVG